MRNGILESMATTEKVTVSLPTELLARIEDRRHGRGASRSEVVSDLLWRGWHQVEAEDREERYRLAYQAQPETDEERAWADDAAADLFAGGSWDTTNADATS
jgi:Arc/MetJ-type ribon-helix-helix transcriptional regulator